LGSTFEAQRCDGGLAKKDEKVLGFRSLEDNPYVYLVDYLKGKELTDF